MKYPKPIMSITELHALGFPREELNRAVHRRGQTFARKTQGGGKWLFDVEEFERFRASGR